LKLEFADGVLDLLALDLINDHPREDVQELQFSIAK
jgi:hypothetical protein